MTFENRIADAEKLQQEINQHRPLKGQALKQLQECFRICLTWSSNALEGNSLIRKDKAGGYKFSWDGNDECDPASGFGEFVCDGDTLTGRIYIHDSDDSSFVAKKRY